MKTTLPNFDYLQQKVKINNSFDLKRRVLKEVNKLNLEEISKDVQVFLFNSADIKQIILSKEYINQVFKR